MFATWIMVGLAFSGLLGGFLGLSQQTAAPLPEVIALRDFLVIGRIVSQGRTAVHVDAVEAQLVSGRWSTPKAGDKITLADGSTRTWEKASAAEDGVLDSQAWTGGYAFTRVEVPAPQAMILEATGPGMVYVNGEPRMGDPYQTGYVRLPVLLFEGANEFLFLYGRGKMKARLVAAKPAVALDVRDATLPDLIAGEKVQTWGAVVVLNATSRPMDNLGISASYGQAPPVLTPIPSIPRWSQKKVAFQLQGTAATAGETCAVDLKLMKQESSRVQALDTAVVKLRVRQATQTRKRTFISRIDRSVQYYAVNPLQPPPLPAAGAKGNTAPALFLSLHGAGVEAIGQADAYNGKSWGYIVAPTNRRPYGFDWEDWGRLDALEVLELAQKQLHTDPQRTYLTGHSMGGHGVWVLGATFPDRFAAIGPSAGWISFSTYGRSNREAQTGAVQEMLMRATAPGDTLTLMRNYSQQGVYILHGGADDNVPVAQARTMNQNLGTFHRDFVFHEQPGAGHWWNISDEPGAACVDWPPMFDFFARHAIPGDASIRQVDFTTANPGISAWSHWVGIEAQIRPLRPSSASIRYDPGHRRFVGTTDNVARISLRLSQAPPGKPILVELDGQKIEGIAWPAGAPQIWLKRENEKWSATAQPPLLLKGPHRYGPFKEAFRNGILLVYGTRGTDEENDWAFAKARYDAEQFWYRGNGSLTLIPDTQFRAAAEPDRDVILYGNAQTNSAWGQLLSNSPLQVGRGSIRVDQHEETGENLACLFLRPRPGSNRASVGVVAGSGIAGMRLTDRLAYFTSGVSYPDYIIIGPEVLAQASAGIKVAGFFGIDWSVTAGEFAGTTK